MQTSPSSPAKFRPSALDSIARCTKKYEHELDMPQAAQSDAAAEGTFAHRVAECMLKGEAFPDAPREMLEHVQQYVDYVRSEMYDVELVEQWVDCKDTIPDCAGTADFIGVHVEENALKIDIHDFKYGRVNVPAKDKYQLVAYAIGALNLMPVNCGEAISFRLFIHQPKIKAPECWELSLQELRVEAEKIKQALTLINEKATFYAPNETSCEYCRFKPQCPALKKLILETLIEDDEPKPIPKVSEDAPGLAQLLDMRKLIRGYLDSLEEYALNALKCGEEIPGYTLAPGRYGNRMWEDETKVLTYLEDKAINEDVYMKKELLSPTQLLGTMPELAVFVVRKEPKEVLKKL